VSDLAFGNPYGEHTGAPWFSGTHIVVVGLGFNIWLESDHGEEQIMQNGRVLVRGIRTRLQQIAAPAEAPISSLSHSAIMRQSDCIAGEKGAFQD
jgi:hypothetical protein